MNGVSLVALIGGDHYLEVDHLCVLSLVIIDVSAPTPKHHAGNYERLARAQIHLGYVFH